MIKNEIQNIIKSQKMLESSKPQIHISENAFSQKKLLDLDISGENQNASSLIDNQSELMNLGRNMSIKKSYRKQKSQLSHKASEFKQICLEKLFFSRHVLKIFIHRFILKSQVMPRHNENPELLREQYLQDQNYFTEQKLNGKITTQYFPILKLQSRFLIYWQLLRIIQYLLLMWWMPFKIAFNQTLKTNTFEELVLYLIILNILILLNKEIIDQGQVIENRKFIFYNYLKSESFLDVVYVTSYVLTIYQFLAFPVLEIVAVVMFFINLFKFQQIINYYKETAQSVNEFMNLMELIITVLILAHFMACIWFHVGMLSKVQYDQSWISIKGLEQESQFIQYFYSFYWATTTMVTVGYGDISPQNIYEVICATILMFFSSGVFAFSINSIGMILTNINQNQSNYKRSLLLINSYMIQNHVSNDLQSKVRNYIKFYCDSKIQNNQQEINNVVNQLSSNLRSELLYDVQSKALNQSAFFTKYFSESAKKLIAQNLEQINFTPQEQIYQQGFQDDCAIYIIQKGEVLIVDQASGKQLQKLKQGDIFGEIEFLTGQSRHSLSYSLSFCQIFKINRNKFIQVIHNESQDIQQFHQLKDQLLMKVGCYQQCQVCQEDHIIWDCNKLFYKPNIEATLKKDLFHSNQDRKFFKRSQNKNLFNLLNQDFVQQSCKEYQEKNDLIQDYESSKDYNEVGLESESVATQTQQQLQSNSYLNKQSRLSINNQHSEESILKIPQQVIKYQDENLKRKSHNVINDDTIKVQVKTSTQFQKNPSMIPFNKTNRQSVVRQVSQLNVPDQTHKILIEYFDKNSDDQFQEIVIDQQKHYHNYFPHNNFQQVLLDLEKFQKKQQKVQTIMVPSNYKFFKTTKIVMSKRSRAKQNIQIDI